MSLAMDRGYTEYGTIDDRGSKVVNLLILMFAWNRGDERTKQVASQRAGGASATAHTQEFWYIDPDVRPLAVLFGISTLACVPWQCFLVYRP